MLRHTGRKRQPMSSNRTSIRVRTTITCVLVLIVCLSMFGCWIPESFDAKVPSIRTEATRSPMTALSR
jgi:hypothetical protein